MVRQQRHARREDQALRSIPRAPAAARRLAVADAFISESHNTLPSIAPRSRIQTSNMAAEIL
jgi:hypothetical protein